MCRNLRRLAHACKDPAGLGHCMTDVEPQGQANVLRLEYRQHRVCNVIIFRGVCLLPRGRVVGLQAPWPNCSHADSLLQATLFFAIPLPSTSSVATAHGLSPSVPGREKEQLLAPNLATFSPAALSKRAACAHRGGAVILPFVQLARHGSRRRRPHSPDF